MLTRRATLAGLAALGFPFAADAQGFPSRSITIIVPYPPGGPVDALARLIAQESAGDLNQPIVVENRPGGSGVIGTQAVARAEPDGHMLVLGTNQTHATNQSLIKNCPYDAVKDFVPVAGIAAMPHVLVARNSLGVTTVGEVVAMARTRPGALTFGSTGNGSGAHLAGELFKTKAGIDMLHVPFKGLSPMLTELLADRVDMSIAPLPGLIGQQIESGSVRALGVARAQRLPQLASVPTFVESGVPGVEADAWSRAVTSAVIGQHRPTSRISLVKSSFLLCRRLDLSIPVGKCRLPDYGQGEMEADDGAIVGGADRQVRGEQSQQAGHVLRRRRPLPARCRRRQQAMGFQIRRTRPLA